MGYYTAASIPLIPWAISFGDPEVNTMMNREIDLREWYYAYMRIKCGKKSFPDIAKQALYNIREIFS
jgi:hypothetical protein